MSVEIDTPIKLIPNSMAVSLQSDILQFMIELKFVLLFVESPLTILSTSNSDFISEEVIADIKNGNQPRTNPFPESSKLTNLDTLATDEFSEVLSNCRPIHFNIKRGNKDEEELKDPDYWNEYFKEVEEIFIKIGASKPGRVGLLFSNHEFISQDPSLEGHLKLMNLYQNMHRLLGVLEACGKEKSSMIWTSTHDQIVNTIYFNYLCENNLLKVMKDKVAKTKGSGLLKEVYDLEIINIATVPVRKVIEFRENNADLLENFMLLYREFLFDLVSNPTEHDSTKNKYTKNIISAFKDINRELLIH